MIGLIKSELFRLKKLLAFKILLIGFMFYALSEIIFIAGGVSDIQDGTMEFINTIMSYGYCLLVCGIFAGLLIAGDFKNRIISANLSVGKSRFEVYAAKNIAYWLVCVTLIITYQFVRVLLAFLMTGSMGNMKLTDLGGFIRLELIFLIILSVLLEICVLAAFLIKKIFAVVAFEAAWIVLGSQLLYAIRGLGSIGAFICDNSPFSTIDHITRGFMVEVEHGFDFMTGENIIKVLNSSSISSLYGQVLLSVLYIIIIFVVGYVFFRKADLK